MVDTRSKNQGLKLEVLVSRTPKKRFQKVSIDELNQIASELMVAYDEIENSETFESRQPTFSDPEQEESEQQFDKFTIQDDSQEVSSKYWSGLLSLNSDLLSNILSSLDIVTTGESQEPYTRIYELLCDVNNPYWELFDSLNALLTDPTMATHFHRVCSHKEIIDVLTTACQNKLQA